MDLFDRIQGRFRDPVHSGYGDHASRIGMAWQKDYSYVMTAQEAFDSLMKTAAWTQTDAAWKEIISYRSEHVVCADQRIVAHNARRAVALHDALRKGYSLRETIIFFTEKNPAHVYYN
jgi:hypothetical protein